MQLKRTAQRDAFIELFEVWEEALPVLDLMVEPDEITLVVAMNGESLSDKEIARRTEFSDDQLSLLLNSAFSRSIINRKKSHNAWIYTQATFQERLVHVVKFGAWNDIPASIRRALDLRSLTRYIDENRLRLEQKKEHDPHNDAVLLLHECEEMIENARNIVIQPCDCRRFGQHCNRPVDVCFVFDEEAEDLLARGKGQVFTKEQAITLVRQADKKGLIHTGDAEWQTNGLRALCNCCACDCYPFRAADSLQSKGTWPKSRYLAVVDRTRCTYCGTCVKRCHFDAFIKLPETVTVQGKKRQRVAYDPDKCWGCGLCASSCKPGSISMKKLQVATPPGVCEPD